MSTMWSMTNGKTRLKAWMDREGLNQRQAAKILGVHYTFLNKLLSLTAYQRCPSMRTASRIERVTGIPMVAWLPTSVAAKKRQPRKPAEATA